jgi:hypothetical protein
MAFRSLELAIRPVEGYQPEGYAKLFGIESGPKGILNPERRRCATSS